MDKNALPKLPCPLLITPNAIVIDVVKKYINDLEKYKDFGYGGPSCFCMS